MINEMNNERPQNLLLVALLATIILFTAFPEGYLSSISVPFWVLLAAGFFLYILYIPGSLWAYQASIFNPFCWWFFSLSNHQRGQRDTGREHLLYASHPRDKKENIFLIYLLRWSSYTVQSFGEILAFGFQSSLHLNLYRGQSTRASRSDGCMGIFLFLKKLSTLDVHNTP